MVEWGDRHYAPNGAPRLLLHAGCGHPIVQQLTCTDCGATIESDEITTALGPGAQPVVT